MRNAFVGASPAPSYRLEGTADNDYLIDRQLQKTKSYSGLVGMTLEDVALQEGMGPICDRSQEHLAYSDQIIIATRRLLFEAMDAIARGEAPKAVDPAEYRTVRGSDRLLDAGADWRTALAPDLIARF